MSEAAYHEIDPILAEVRRNREALSARFDHDIRRMMQYMNEQARRSGRKVVTLPPRKPSSMPPAA